MLRGLEYGPDGSLQDDTGHCWIRISDWVEPTDAEQLVGDGTCFVIQRCCTPPVAGRAERFIRDVRAHLVTTAVADTHSGKTSVPTVMVGELWRSKDVGDLLLFVEQGPYRRHAVELQNNW